MSITSLPTELFLQITRCIAPSDLKALASVNAYLRKTTLPILFCHLRVDNKTEDADISCLEKYGHYATSLTVECHLTPNQIEESRSGSPEGTPSYDLPQSTASLLRGEYLIHNTKVCIKFLPYDNFMRVGFADNAWATAIHDRPEEENDVLESEEKYEWRALVNKVFRGLAQNHHIKTLSIQNMVPRLCSIFYDSQWDRFLGHIETFDIELWGGDNGVGWRSNTTAGYGNSVEGIRSIFFDQLSSATRVRFCANEGNPAGCEGRFNLPIPLGSKSLPKVESLTLENCFIDSDLVQFLKATNTIKALKLENCFAAPENKLIENPISWQEFFVQVSSLQPSQLKRLEVNNDYVPLWDIFDDTSEEAENFRQEILHGRVPNKDIKLFSYRFLDDKYGMVFEEEERNAESAKDGLDYKAYQELLSLLEKN